jgi:hypothetical protein
MPGNQPRNAGTGETIASGQQIDFRRIGSGIDMPAADAGSTGLDLTALLPANPQEETAR